MSLNRCECINKTDRGNILFLLNLKIDEMNRTIKEIKQKRTIKTKYDKDIEAMKDSLVGTRNWVIDTPICE